MLFHAQGLSFSTLPKIYIKTVNSEEALDIVLNKHAEISSVRLSFCMLYGIKKL
uniref:Uncharacterized protein n=1 Tax=uncultured Desulfobacterium sp. TaxID=201089 RepID=E1YMS7_9BACT|nr:unknown protein [uncultured Desulfobacterium sp.]